MWFAVWRGRDWKGRALRRGDLFKGQKWGLTEAETLGWRGDHDPDSALPNHDPIIRILRVRTAVGQQNLQAWGGAGVPPWAVSELWSADPFPPLGSSQPTAPARGSECTISEQLRNGRPQPQSAPEAAHTHLHQFHQGPQTPELHHSQLLHIEALGLVPANRERPGSSQAQ